MSQYLADVYSADQVGATVIAAQTPNDQTFHNVLIAARGNEILFGESGAKVMNEMIGLRGDDLMYGGGAGAINSYSGGGGIDVAVIPAPSYTSLVDIDYQGGVTVYRADGGGDVVSSDTEIIRFSNGYRLLPISAGVDDTSWETNWVTWIPGDSLAIGLDWVAAFNFGRATIQRADVDLNGFVDTVLAGLPGVNTYALLNYDIAFHSPAIAGVFGSGVILDLN